MTPYKTWLSLKLISLDEVHLAIVALQTGKTTGADGLPVEFLKAHVNSVAPNLHNILTET